MTRQRPRHRFLRARTRPVPSLPPLPFPEAPHPNVRHTLRGIAHPRAPGNLALAIAWAYVTFPPPEGDGAFRHEIVGLLAEHDELLANEGPEPDPFFTGFLDDLVEETLDVQLPANLSGREILEGFLTVAGNANR